MSKRIMVICLVMWGSIQDLGTVFGFADVTMGLLADQVLKGVRNVDFKYGGSGVELSEILFKMGLLSQDPVNVDGTTIVPRDLVLHLCPPAPKYPDEIKAIIDRGGIKEQGAFLVRVDGTRDDKPIRIDSYVNAPGLVESFQKSGLSHEAYLTGQCAAVFVKMMVEDVFTEKGLFVPEQLGDDARDWLLDQGWLPPHLEEAYDSLTAALMEAVSGLSEDDLVIALVVDHEPVARPAPGRDICPAHAGPARAGPGGP